MRDAIIEKLTQFLAQSPRREADVVYALVEVRKLLEREGKKKVFKTLTLFCDWVVHVKLDRRGADDILTMLDARLCTLDLSKPQDITPDNVVRQFVSLYLLHEELKRFCAEMKLPNRWTTDWQSWIRCLRFYGNIVLDCPLAVCRQDHKGKYTQKLVLKTTDVQPEAHDKESLVFEWEFTFNDGTTFKQSHLYSYPTNKWNPSKPTTTEFGI